MFDTQFSTVKRDTLSDILTGNIFLTNEDHKSIKLYFSITHEYLTCSPVVKDYVEDLYMWSETKALTFIQNVIKKHTDYIKEFFKSTDESVHTYVLFFCISHSGFDWCFENFRKEFPEYIPENAPCLFLEHDPIELQKYIH